MQCAAPPRIEMCDNFVEQEHWRRSGHLRDQASMRENEPDQQRLLLTGRGSAGGDVLAHIDDRQVRYMRAVEGAARGGVARSAVAQHSAIAFLYVDGRMTGQQPLHPA